MAFKLSSELVDVAKGWGTMLKKKVTHKIAEADVAKGLGYHAKKESDSQNSRSI
jgi:hypothetical protein